MWFGRFVLFLVLFVAAVAGPAQGVSQGENPNTLVPNRVPGVWILTPQDGTVITSNALFLVAYAMAPPGTALELVCRHDGTGQEFRCDGGSFPDGGGVGLWNACFTQYPANPFPEGTVTCTARFYDTATGASVLWDQVVLTLDRTLPTVSLISPADGACFTGVEPPVLVSATAADDHGIRHAEVYLDDELIYVTDYPKPYPKDVTIETSLPPFSEMFEGVHELQVWAFDGAGWWPARQCRTGPNISATTSTFVLDRPPVVVLDLIDTLSGEEAEACWTAVNDPPVSQLTRARVYLSGELVATLPGNQSCCSIDTTRFPDGAYVLRVEVDDECGTGWDERPIQIVNH